MSLSIVLILIFTSVSCNNLLRVHNGEESDNRFLVKIVINKPTQIITCSGSILNAFWVISAAHCIEAGPISKAVITVNYKCKPIQVSEIIMHPYYHPGDVNLNNIKHDIALLRASTAMEFCEFVVPIELAASVPVNGQLAEVAGFGLPDLKAREGVVTLSYCVADLLCSHSVDSLTRPGRGDSGGPLVSEGKLIGIDSTSMVLKVTEHRSGQQGKLYTEYYADVASNIDWINSVIMN